MKKFYLSIALLLVAGIAMAQLQAPASLIKQYGAVPMMSKQIPMFDNSKAAGDTVGLSSNYLPQIVLANLVGGYGLTQTGLGKIGYWWGTSGAPMDTAMDIWIQCYENTGGTPIVIEGIGFYCVNKEVVAGDATTDTIFFLVNKLLPDGCGIGYSSGTWTYGPGPQFYYSTTAPDGTLLGMTYMTLADVDTSLTNGLVFNYAAFDAPITVTGSNPDGFAITADFHQPRVNGDTIYLVCDDQGDGQQLMYSQSAYVMPDFSSYYAPTSNYFTYNGTAGGLDNNGALFAIISGGGGINDDYFQGMKLSARNTSDGQTILDYAVENAGNVTFKIHDIAGKYVAGYMEGNKSAGSYSLNLNTNLPTGQYLVIMTAGGNMMGKQIFVR
jgi:hypothetical protein